MVNKIDITTVQTKLDMAKTDVASISPERLPHSIYEAITASALRSPERIALRYILDGDCIAPNKIPFAKKALHQVVKLVKGHAFAAPYREISYHEVAQRVTQVSNALHSFGIGRTDVTSIILPNFPEMYFSLWGAETTGIANPINPLLEANIIKEIITGNDPGEGTINATEIEKVRRAVFILKEGLLECAGTWNSDDAKLAKEALDQAINIVNSSAFKKTS